MNRFGISHTPCFPTYTVTTKSTYTLAEIAELNATGDSTLVVEEKNVYDLTWWIVESGSESGTELEVERQRFKMLAGENAENAGQVWAELVGDQKGEFKVGTLVPEHATGEEDQTRPTPISPPESFVPSRSGSPVAAPSTGAALPNIAQPTPSSGRGLSHLEYALALLTQRQGMLQAAKRNAESAFVEVREAERLVREAEALRDGLVLMAMEGERPRWSASWP